METSTFESSKCCFPPSDQGGQRVDPSATNGRECVALLQSYGRTLDCETKENKELEYFEWRNDAAKGSRFEIKTATAQVPAGGQGQQGTLPTVVMEVQVLEVSDCCD